jgi:hypothetical protein
MSILSVRRTGKRFTIAPGRRNGAGRSRELPGFVALSATANRIASEISELIGDRYWRLEYSKLVAANGFAVIGQGREIAEQARTGEPEQLFSGVVDNARVRFACAHDLAASGHNVAGLGAMKLFLRLRYCISVLTAFSVWLWTLLRSGWGNRLAAIPEGACLIVVHGENSNRTRHALAAAGQSDAVAAILVLGRPAASLASVRATFSSEFGLGDIPVCRPIGLGGALKCLPRLFGLFAAGSRIVSATGFIPRWQDEIAILYRMCLGACACAWWTDQGAVPGTIIYGQTGLADTSLLEHAQQQVGAKTVHWVHGLSGGWNFAGYSDLGLFKCGYDTDLHAGLPDYGRTDFIPMPKVGYRGGRGSRWLLMTNYAHPSNPYFGHGAYDLEIAAVRMAAEAAEQAGIGKGNLVWRPHPVFWSLPDIARERICAAVGEIGVALPAAGGEAPSFSDYQAVMCTPSTAAIDALATGHLPIIVAPHEIAVETVYDAFPLRAADAGELYNAVSRIADSSAAAGLYDKLWESVRPGAPAITIGDIAERLASGLRSAESDPV